MAAGSKTIGHGSEPQGGLGNRLVSFANRLNLTYWLVIAGSALARRVPTRASYAVASFIGDLVFLTWSEKRNNAIANMRRILGPGASESRARRTAQLSYRNYLKYTVDFLRFPSLSAKQIRDAVDVVGLDHLNRALAEGKGVIFVGVHFGHFDWGAATLAVFGYPVHAVVDTFRPAKLNDLIQRHRIEKGLKVIPLEGAARGVLRALKNKEILGLLVDKPMPGEGVRVNFFGAPIEVPAGAATLALKTGAPIIAGHIVREDDRGKFSGIIYPPLQVERSGDLRHDVVVLTQRMMDLLGEMIQQHPEQWYMFRRMWDAEALQSAGTT